MKNNQIEPEKYTMSAVNLIIEALFELMKKDSYDKISITSIAKKADVSRLSYYRNFQTKEDIVLSFFEQEFNKFSIEISSWNETEISFRHLIRTSFSYWGKRAERIRLLIRDDQVYLIYISFNKYSHILLEQYKNKFDLSFWQTKFLEGGILIVLLEWIQNGCKETPNEIAKDLDKKYRIDDYKREKD